MTNAKSRINDFSKGKNIKAYAGGLSSIASKAVEKIGNTASKAKDLAKNNPRIIIAAAILAVAVGSMEPASACNVGLIANNITNQNAYTPSSAEYIASL
ncbi:MAG: hypothetical protein KAJ75_01990 [Alphaproteobacteria bacterium]|nr:hypothetical protein [Alphaproteobacteria bacterium]